jgi:hypothetical protein
MHACQFYPDRKQIAHPHEKFKKSLIKVLFTKVWEEKGNLKGEII